MRPLIRMSGPVLDAADVPALAQFYERFLGWPIEDDGPFWAVLRPETLLAGHKIEIQHEPHFVPPVWPAAAGSQGMQVHLDFWVDDLERGVAWCLECGGTEAAWQPPSRDLTHLRVMLDPAGHPFCLWS
ncbi:MAG TPA: VOC family protein [Acidimicrobiales bacterium]|nr:VOC family protein [Acidimicrobiales bacterium]